MLAAMYVSAITLLALGLSGYYNVLNISLISSKCLLGIGVTSAFLTICKNLPFQLMQTKNYNNFLLFQSQIISGLIPIVVSRNVAHHELKLETIKAKAKEKVESFGFNFWQPELILKRPNWHSEGMCQGICELFIQQYHQKLKKGISIKVAVEEVTDLFKEGAPLEAVIMQYLQFTCNIAWTVPLCKGYPDLPPCFVRHNLYVGHFMLNMNAKMRIAAWSPIKEDYSVNQNLTQLTNGSYQLTFQAWEGESVKAGHALIYIKNDDLQFLFDPNYGLFIVENSIGDFLQKFLSLYKNKSFTHLFFLKIHPD